MQIRSLALASTILAAALLAACSGGSTSPNPIITPPSSAPEGGNPGPDPYGYNADSIGAVNAIGAPMQSTTPDELGGIQNNNVQIRRNNNTPPPCTNFFATSFQFFTPDQKGDPNSTEMVRYEGAGCCTERRNFRHGARLESDQLHIGNGKRDYLQSGRRRQGCSADVGSHC